MKNSQGSHERLLSNNNAHDFPGLSSEDVKKLTEDQKAALRPYDRSCMCSWICLSMVAGVASLIVLGIMTEKHKIGTDTAEDRNNLMAVGAVLLFATCVGGYKFSPSARRPAKPIIACQTNGVYSLSLQAPEPPIRFMLIGVTGSNIEAVTKFYDAHLVVASQSIRPSQNNI